jgi:hypothetical protein
LQLATTRQTDSTQNFGSGHPGLKNDHRIQEIDSSMEANTQVTLLSSTMSRIMRKDWNIVCAKMYVFSLDRAIGHKINDALNALHWQVSDLVESPTVSIFKYSDTSWLKPEDFELRVVSAEAASWLRAICKIDDCVAKLLTAQHEGHIDKQIRVRALAAVSLAYTNFKFIAMNTTPPTKGDSASNIFD